MRVKKVDYVNQGHVVKSYDVAPNSVMYMPSIGETVYIDDNFCNDYVVKEMRTHLENDTVEIILTKPTELV